MLNKQTILARPVLARFSSKLKQFEPQTLVAWSSLETLLAGGTEVEHVSRDSVRLRRGPQTATMDKQGRVEWSTDHGYFTRLKAKLPTNQKQTAPDSGKNPKSRVRRKLKSLAMT